MDFLELNLLLIGVIFFVMPDRQLGDCPVVVHRA